MANILNTPEQVKAAAQEMIQHSEEQATERKNVVVKLASCRQQPLHWD